MPSPPHTVQLQVGVVDLVQGVLRRHDGTVERLTTKERDLLVRLVQRPAEVVTRAELLSEIWGYAPSSVTRAVDHAVRRLRAKVEVLAKEPRHVLTVHGEGYRFVPLELDEASAMEETEPQAATDALIGRLADVGDLERALASARCVVVCGPGGVGKTTLALAVAPSGSLVVHAADATSEPALCAAVAAALNVHADALDDALIAWSGLLVLDNLEQVAESAGPRIAAWLAGAPDLRVLATSRIQLAVDGGVTLHLASLAVPDAVDLLRRRARQHGVHDLADEDTLHELVMRLDRLPLAIELAAARLPVLGVRDMMERLHARFAVLGEQPHRVARHRSLWAAIECSWDLLSSAEQRALVRCATFQAGVSVDGAESVLGAEALTLLERLRVHSLLTRVHGAVGRVRLGVLESVRDFVLQQDEAEVQFARAAHAEFFVQRAPAWADAAQRSAEASHRLRRERSNLLAAHAFCTQEGRWNDALALAEALEWDLSARGPSAVYRALVQRTRAGAPGARASALEARFWLGTGDKATAALVLEAHGDSDDPVVRLALVRVDRAQGRFEVASAGAADLVHTLPFEHPLRAIVEHQAALIAYDAGDWTTAAMRYDRALRAARQGNNVREQALVLLHRGHSRIEAGDCVGAHRDYEASAALLAELDDRRAASIAVTHLALALQELGDGDAALERIGEALAGHRAVGNVRFEGYARCIEASIYTDSDAFVEAERCASEGLERLERVGDRAFAGLAAARLGVAYAGQGRAGLAEAYLSQAVQQTRDVPHLEAGCDVLYGFALLASGDRQGAQDRVHNAPHRERSNLVRTAVRQLLHAIQRG